MGLQGHRQDHENADTETDTSTVYNQYKHVRCTEKEITKNKHTVHRLLTNSMSIFSTLNKEQCIFQGQI